MPPAAPAKLETQNIYGLELLRVGSGNGRVYTKEDIAATVDGYRKLLDYGYKPVAKLGHNPEQHLLTQDGLPNAGVVEEMYLSADGEAAVVDVAGVPKKVAQFIEIKGYGPRSSELWIDKPLIPDQPNIPMALKSFAWLGADAPALKNLNDIEALYHAEGADDERILQTLDELWHRPMEPSVYLDDKGEVSVVVLGQSDDGGAEPGGGMVPNGTEAKDSDPPNHGPRTGTHSHAHAAYGAANAVSTGASAMHNHEHAHSGDASHNPSGTDHVHPQNLGGDSADPAPQTPDDIVVNADATPSPGGTTPMDQGNSDRLSAAASEMLAAIAENKGDPKSPPKGYPTDKSKYADPTNWKFPLDTDARIHSAVSYFNAGAGKSKYSAAEWATIGGKIASAAKGAFGDGYSFANGKISTPSTTAKNADTPDPEDAFEDIIGDLYWALCCDMGAPFANASWVRIKRTWDNGCLVKVLPGNGAGGWQSMNGIQNFSAYAFEDEPDQHYFVPYTREPGGEPVIGTPQPVEMNFQVMPASTEMSESGAAPQITEGETVNDAEYRKFWGLADDADVKQHMIGLRTSTVSLADHNATIERLNKIEANAKLTEATAKVEKMKASGQIGGPKETVEALEKFAIDLALSDPERFDIWMANQPKVIDYSVQGLAEDGVDPNAAVGLMTGPQGQALGAQAQRDLVKANAGMGVTSEQIAARQGTSFDSRREAAIAKAREANPAINWETGRELGRVFHSR